MRQEFRSRIPETLRETTVPSLVGIQLSSPARAKVGVSVTPRNVGEGGWMKDSRVSQGDSSVETARSEHARIEAAHGARIDDSSAHLSFHRTAFIPCPSFPSVVSVLFPSFHRR